MDSTTTLVIFVFKTVEAVRPHFILDLVNSFQVFFSLGGGVVGHH